MYSLTVIGYLKKKHHEALCLSFIDNSNKYIIALEIAIVTKELTHIGGLTNTESYKNDFSNPQQFKVLLFVTYSIIQDIISSEM